MARPLHSLRTMDTRTIEDFNAPSELRSHLINTPFGTLLAFHTAPDRVTVLSPTRQAGGAKVNRIPTYFSIHFEKRDSRWRAEVGYTTRLDGRAVTRGQYGKLYGWAREWIKTFSDPMGARDAKITSLQHQLRETLSQIDSLKLQAEKLQEEIDAA